MEGGKGRREEESTGQKKGVEKGRWRGEEVSIKFDADQKDGQVERFIFKLHKYLYNYLGDPTPIPIGMAELSTFCRSYIHMYLEC